MSLVPKCLDQHLGNVIEGQRVLVWKGEGEGAFRLTCRELARAANGPRALGSGPGDSAGLCMPLTSTGHLPACQPGGAGPGAG